MVQKCCIAFCKIRYDLKPTGVMLHRFPRSNTRREAWLSNVQKINGTKWQPSDSSFVCSAHFDLASWEATRQDGKRQLRQNAVPTVFCRPSVRFCPTPMLETVVIPEASSVPLDHSYMRRCKIVRQPEAAESKSVVPQNRSISLDHSYTGKHQVSHGEDVSPSTPSACTTKETDDSGLNLLLLCLEPQQKATETETEPENLLPTGGAANHTSVNNSKKSEDVNVNSKKSEDANVNSKKSEDVNVNSKKSEDVNVNGPCIELLRENQCLQDKYFKLNQLAEKLCRQNNTLKRSYKELSSKYRTLRDIHRRTQEGLKNVFSEDQFKALSRRSTQGLKWHPKTIEEALTLRNKLGTAGYKLLQRRFPYPNVRTLQREIKQQSQESGSIAKVLEPSENVSP